MKYHTKKKERMQSTGIWLLALGVLLAGIVCLANLQAYAVSDGEQTIHVYLLSENTEQALEAAGFPPEDYAVVSESDSDWMRNVTLQKKFEVVISADGTMQTIKTIGAPVSQLLAEAGVDLGA